MKHKVKLPHKEFQPESFGELASKPHFLNLINLLHKNSDASVYAYNKIDVLADGESTFSAMFEAIKSAQHHIHLEFFIFEDDRVSNHLRELLIQKAEAGVTIRMIYDYVGSYGLSRQYIKSLKKASVHIHPFLPLRLRMRRSKVNFRNHRKILVVDGKYGFTGGLNFADRYIFGNTLGKWRDTFVRFEGAAVHGLQTLFLTDWYFVEHKLITDSRYYPEPTVFDKNIVQIVHSGPDSDWESIMQGIASAIMSAQHYVYLHTPYFVPNEVILNAVIIAALSGIDIKLIIPKKSDAKLSDACTFSYLGEILEAGVKVFQYKEGFLHSKAIVIDDFVSIIGSANLDERSFNQNFEINAFIYNTKTSLELKKLFEEDLFNSKEITLSDWHNRKKHQKLKESFARLFSPIL